MFDWSIYAILHWLYLQHALVCLSYIQLGYIFMFGLDICIYDIFILVSILHLIGVSLLYLVEVLHLLNVSMQCLIGVSMI